MNCKSIHWSENDSNSHVDRLACHALKLYVCLSSWDPYNSTVINHWNNLKDKDPTMHARTGMYVCVYVVEGNNVKHIHKTTLYSRVQAPL